MNTHLSIEQIRAQMNTQGKPQIANQESSVSFLDVISKKNEELKFSKHANDRLINRNINLSPEQINRLHNGKEMSGTKGIKNSLVLIDDYAFIVNVPNNTVITAMDKNETKNNVFTNIDGAVIAWLD